MSSMDDTSSSSSLSNSLMTGYPSSFFKILKSDDYCDKKFCPAATKIDFFTRAFWWLPRYIFGRLQSLLPMDFQRKPSPPNREAQSGVQTPSTLWHTKEILIQSDGCYFSKYLLTLCDMYKTFNFCKLRMGFKRSIWL